MDKAQRMEQFGEWEKNGEFEKIANAIEQLPAQEQDFDVLILLARAYNELKCYKQAKELLDNMEESRRSDPRWNLHYGYALFSMNHYKEAKESFEKVLEINPNDEGVGEMLRACDECMNKEYWKQSFGDGKHLDKEETLRYILNYSLHGCFEAEDMVEEDHIEIPSWNMSIYPEIYELKEQSVILSFSVTCPDWDREIVEHCAAPGKTPAEAMGMACGNFLFGVMSGITACKKGTKPIAVTSTFAGDEHRWNVHRSNILALGNGPKLKDFDYYWNELKEELPKRIGNQKICYVKVYVAKHQDQVSAECRINDVPVDSLTNIVRKMAEKWGKVEFASHKQFFFFVQEKETTKSYPFSQEQLEEFTQGAMRLFHQVRTQEEYQKLPYRIERMTGDVSLATELFLFLPEICAQQGFSKMVYPEILIFLYGEEEKRVYQTQLASYHTIRQAALWCLRNHIFGEETDTVFHELVSVSSVFRTLQRSKDQGKMLPEGTVITPAFRVDEHYKLR